MSNDGIVIVLDFTRPNEVTESRDVLSHSHRSTTSSRRPGAKIEGTVTAFTRRVVVCKDCGSKRLDFDGPHALVMVGEETKRDCAGRIYKKGVLVNE